ncbi:DUF2784 family protein [Xylophilus sp. GOD-11R]|uniref:DUF2784 family protein n=1 Tax=Xylophilus sp. GOD-11R TaxID=3089814 RepID=UPI00298C438B|nr:DUF2784 family protein [Xylophilus sp. GOD-11R]WPB58476.1 DUF2784 family protein [Xylophilus sp. GOD-11R]
MRISAPVYALLNGLLHAIHLGVIAFAVWGWVSPALRPAHLALMLLILGSWFVLGRWWGIGYCPLSDWHSKLKAAAGGGRPAGSYIHQVLTTLLRRTVDATAVDRLTLYGTLALTALSIALNVKAWLA